MLSVSQFLFTKNIFWPMRHDMAQKNKLVN